jgi:menaquinone-dependent protoporphyrinogen oxidase
MRVLVAVASKHGSTTEIAERIGAGIRDGLAAAEGGADVDVRPADEIKGIGGYDAVVLGSAVYAGRWLPPARELVGAFAIDLAARPVYLFSSGPIGDPPKPTEDPVDATDMIDATAAREHRVFAGRLERRRLGFAEKAIVVALRVPDGDFRDWAAIDAWAAKIADELAGASGPPTARSGR